MERPTSLEPMISTKRVDSMMRTVTARHAPPVCMVATTTASYLQCLFPSNCRVGHADTRFEVETNHNNHNRNNNNDERTKSMMMKPILTSLTLCLTAIIAPACVDEGSPEDSQWRHEDLADIKGSGDVDCPDCYWDLSDGEVAISVPREIMEYNIDDDYYEVDFRLMRNGMEISIPIFFDKGHCFQDHCETLVELRHGSIHFATTKPLSLAMMDGKVISRLIEEIEKRDDVGLESPSLGLRFRLEKRIDL